MAGTAWSRIDQSFLFDPARWPARGALVALGGIVGSLAFIARRISFLPRFPGVIPAVAEPMQALQELLSLLPGWLQPRPFNVLAHYGGLGFSIGEVNALWCARACIWSVETGVWVAYIVGFALRVPARSLARGFMETAYPAMVAMLPMALVSAPYSLDTLLARWPALDATSMFVLDVLLVLGGALHVYALFTLRHAFTITTEARTLVQHGPYRWVRHPVYAAHFLVFGCQALLRPGWLSALLYGAFVVAQTVRAQREEAKLEAAFPEYGAYKARTGRFWPHAA